MLAVKFYIVAVAAIGLITIVYGQSTYFPSLPRPTEEIPLSERQFRVVYEWKTIDFAYRSENERNAARELGEFIDRNVVISDIKAFANHLYVTLPRMLPGVPTTLGYIISPDINGPTDPMVSPFPSWEMNQIGNCDSLQFVQGIAIDSEGILWAVDSGRTNTLQPGSARTTCKPKIMLFDLKRNGSIVHIHEFPDNVVTRGTNYLNKIVVDDAFGGFAYITDNSGSDPGIVVFSWRLNRSWKLRENNSMRAASNAIDFAVNGTNLRFSIHIDGIALGPYYNPHADDPLTANSPKFSGENYERNVYYAPLSSYHLYSLPASILRDPEFARRATQQDVFEQVIDYGVKLSQSDGMIMDNRGILYYGLLKEHAIAQWDSFQSFSVSNQHVIAKDDDFIQWIDGMTIDEYGYLYVVVNRLHNFVAGRLNPTEINFRLLRAKVGSLSYVYTNGLGVGNVGVNLLPSDGEPFGNRIGVGGISSTTPFYNPLEGRNPNNYNNYYNSATNLISSSTFYYILSLLSLIIINTITLMC